MASLACFSKYSNFYVETSKQQLSHSGGFFVLFYSADRIEVLLLYIKQCNNKSCLLLTLLDINNNQISNFTMTSLACFSYSLKFVKKFKYTDGKSCLLLKILLTFKTKFLIHAITSLA
jgi:hypothetical protein